MQRVLIIGSAGAGKSTLSRRIGEALNIPVIHLDAFYWQPGWVATEREEWEQVVKAHVAKDTWVLDGNYSATLDMRLERADTVIFLDMPRLLCLYRVIKRRIQYRGRTRPDLNEGCPERLDWPFIVWIWNYRKRSRSKVIAKLEACGEEKQVIILDSRHSIQNFISSLTRQI
ncbi:DNA topology modulation protein [Paenibacillus sp. HW567]|uniref:DNA topology modulation protein n=1 Tax=Paenibacillus sp. HW567 TaxID=1034769 RepID=UPI00036C2A49|nr:DNA topology modulation protein [Paenibacillus sp. HW567]